IERSTDARNFMKIGQVYGKNGVGNSAAGNSATGSSDTGNSAAGASVVGTSVLYYQFNDQSPVSGMNFYRVKVVDADGTVKYSPVVSVNRNNVNAQLITVYPNPVLGNALTLQTELPKGRYNITMISRTGEQIFKKEMNHQGGSASQVISIPAGISSGVYQLIITGEGIQISRQILKGE
ncbi:MAG TPA: T9SS type A sorting domain-containing protein, partial [Parasegetibacter sp.]